MRSGDAASPPPTPPPSAAPPARLRRRLLWTSIYGGCHLGGESDGGRADAFDTLMEVLARPRRHFVRSAAHALPGGPTRAPEFLHDLYPWLRQRAATSARARDGASTSGTIVRAEVGFGERVSNDCVASRDGLDGRVCRRLPPRDLQLRGRKPRLGALPQDNARPAKEYPRHAASARTPAAHLPPPPLLSSRRPAPPTRRCHARGRVARRIFPRR